MESRCLEFYRDSAMRNQDPNGRELGLPPELIEAALAAGPDWRALASAARARRFGRPAPADDRDKARQARFLQYRGFSADHIRAATGADSDTD
jgi:regulatory protein